MPDKSLEFQTGDPDPLRVEVWVAMADHFLDTETRQDIPLTSLRCVAAGLSVPQARLVWQYEVSPAVGANLWSVAGEWGCWDRDWLVAQIQHTSKSWCQKAGTGRWLRYRLLVHFNHSVWVSLGRCMQLLWSLPSSEQREQMTRDLSLLTAHYFDFCPRSLSELETAQLGRLRTLCSGPFQHILRPALMPSEAASAERRLQLAVLGETTS